MKKTGVWIAAGVLIVAMTAAAELLAEGEIIFPETAALVVGAWLAPRLPWRVSPLKIFAAVSICALCGVLIVRFLPLPLLPRLLLGYCVAAVVLTCLDITLVPAVSGVLLPILLGTDSFVYPVAAAALAGIVALGRSFLAKRQLASAEPEPKDIPAARMLLLWGGRLLVIAAVAGGALAVDAPFAVAPPLLAAFTELTDAASPGRKKPLRIWGLTVFAAICGCGCRLLICDLAGLPLAAATAISIGLFLLVTAKTRLFFPPAAAIAILPMLVESEALWLFSAQVGAGFGALIVIALLVFGREGGQRSIH